MCIPKKTTPRTGGTVPGRLTNNVKETNVMAKLHSNQVHLKYQYIFLALSRANLQDKPHREDVIACSEREARSLLAGRFILSFAGRIPFEEARHD